jgi:hypothetical protein
MSQVVLDHGLTSSVAARSKISTTMSVIPGLLAAPEAATRFVQFVNASPTPFHAVHNAAVRLEKAGFAKVCLCFSRALLVFSAFVD